MECPLKRAFINKGRPTLCNETSGYFARSVTSSTPSLCSSKEHYYSVLCGLNGYNSTCASQHIYKWVLGQLLPVVMPWSFKDNDYQLFFSTPEHIKKTKICVWQISETIRDSGCLRFCSTTPRTEGINMLANLEPILGKSAFFKTLIREHCPKTFCLGKEGSQSLIPNPSSISPFALPSYNCCEISPSFFYLPPFPSLSSYCFNIIAQMISPQILTMCNQSHS